MAGEAHRCKGCTDVNVALNYQSMLLSFVLCSALWQDTQAEPTLNVLKKRKRPVAVVSSPTARTSKSIDQKKARDARKARLHTKPPEKETAGKRESYGELVNKDVATLKAGVMSCIFLLQGTGIECMMRNVSE